MLFTTLLAACASCLTLDEIALTAGTDKSSAFHNYTPLYEKEFDRFREKPIRFLEIGIQKGHSVKMWEEFFPTAELYFIDITESAIEYFSTRSSYFYLDQSNASALSAFIKDSGGDFDIIIDDGGHTMEQQIVSFQTLFPALKPGGIYVIEDLHTSYWKEYGGRGSLSTPLSSSKSTTEFLKSLVDNVNWIAAKTGCADQKKATESLENLFATYRRQIEGIYFSSGVCLIYKRTQD